MLFIGKKSSKLFHFFDLNSKYHWRIKFFYLEEISIEELKNSGLFEDHIFELTEFKNDIFMFNQK